MQPVPYLNELKLKLNAARPELTDRFNVLSLGIFGSYIRNQANADSDLDLLVSFTEVPSLLEFIALENYLSDLLGVQVDLVMEDALKPHIGAHIQAEVERI